MRITAIRPQRGSPRRYDLFVDGALRMEAGEAALAEAGLFAGAEVSEEALCRLLTLEKRHFALEKAAELLSYRAHSAGELVEKLRRRRISEEDAAWAVGRLAEGGCLDDGAYARALAEEYAGKGFGPRRIESELFKRRIGREIIRKTLSPLILADHGEAIRRLILKKHGEGPFSDRREQGRIAALLVRYGYAYEDIAPVMDEWERLF